MTDRINPLDFRRKQRSTLPSDIVRNDAFFWAFLIKGARPLTRIQKIGSLIIGSVLLLGALSIATMLYWEPVATGDEGGLFTTSVGWIVAIVLFAVCGYCGWRMVRNALAPKGRS